MNKAKDGSPYFFLSGNGAADHESICSWCCHCYELAKRGEQIPELEFTIDGILVKTGPREEFPARFTRAMPFVRDMIRAAEVPKSDLTTFG